MDKTIVVAVELVTRHRLYGRTLRRSRSFKAHDEQNRCEIGDTVLIAESRPLSKDKHWMVTEILRRGTGEPVEIEEVPSLEPEPPAVAPADEDEDEDEE